MNEVAKFPVATIVEVSIIGVYPASAYPTLQTLVEKFSEELTRAFVEVGGRDSHNSWAEVRQATREEVFRFMPRKMHFYAGGNCVHLCDTVYVAKRNMTSDREKVTCKLCRRKLGIAGD
jgi:hypothetical protein